jgi:predicted dehydrogenase/glycosyltransferase involved in cell wall biosynthesis/threonine dehydrogenase-like Zn-dependent dehydrogenase
MLALGRALSVGWNVTMALLKTDSGGFLPRAARYGLGIKLAENLDEFEDWVASAGFDLLHVHAGIGWEGHEIAAAGIAQGIPVIRTEHLPYLLTDPAQRDFYRDQIKGLSHHIVVSGASKSSYDDHISAGNLTVVRNGIFPITPKGTLGGLRQEIGLQERTILLTVARFSAQKDHATLLRALAGVVAARPSVILLLVGSGERLEEMQALGEALGLIQHIRFLGHRSDVADIMAMADLFVLPSRFEGLPLAVLEAMSLGVPVVATSVGGTIEALGEDHSYYVQAGEPNLLAAAILSALNNPRQMAAVADEEQRRFRAEFSADRMARETEAIYDRFLKTAPNPIDRTQLMQKTRIAFIGAGGIAQRHLDILANFEDVELVGFADPDLDRADQAAMRFGAKSYQHHREMLDAQRPDAVFVCVPPFAHGEPERDLVERGVPFFVEKPVSLDLETAEAISASVAAKGLITAVGYHWRYLDIVDEAKRLLSDNPAQLLSGYWLDSTPPPKWWWKQDKSGGQMIEQTTHLLDLVRFLVGEVKEVYGRVGYKDRPDFPGLDVPTVTTASLTFETGVVANFASTCLLGWNHRVGLHIFADRLAIELTDREIMVDVGRGRPVRGADGDPVWREDRDFIDAVRGGENRIRCPYSEAVATHRLALAIVSSAETGKPLTLQLPDTRQPEPAPLQSQPRAEAPRGMPHGHRKILSLGVEAPGKPYFFEYEEGPPSDGQVRLDTLYTGLSAGTELTFLKNTNPYFRSRFDSDRGAFIDNEPDLHYPVPFLGYMEVARVADPRVPDFQRGSIVAGAYGHKTGHTANPSHDMLIRLPEGLDPVLGVLVAQMGPIAANGILHADADACGGVVPMLGVGIRDRPVLVIGAGTVGLMTALFAQALGASDVVITDPSEFRRSKAEAMGLTAMTDDQAWRHAKDRWHDGAMGRGADFVFQTRAHPDSLHTALKALRPQGTVIDLAFYQGGADTLRLGEEFHHNGLNIRCAQINRVPRGLAPLWNKLRLASATLDLLKLRGQDIREHMITHIVPIDDARSFLTDLVENRPDFLQVVFQVGQ